MRLIITICFLMLSISNFGQSAAIGYWEVERIEADEAQTLANKISALCKNDKEKVSAIFRWITANISYQIRPWYNRPTKLKATSKYQVEDPSDTATILKPLDERVADLVIRRKEAFCDGYARLFKTLCDYNGIKARVVTGYSRVGMDRGGKNFRSNHTWNAVYLDSSWHLLDVTWASGFLTYSSNEFVQRVDEKYFLPPPSQFINDHYPEDLQWTLLPEPPNLKEYNVSPFKQQGFVRMQITGYIPEKGVVETALGDTIYFELSTNSTIEAGNKDTLETENLNSPQSSEPVWANITPITIRPGKFIYSYIVQSPAVKFINLIYSDKVIMRYRLNISKPLLTVAE